MDKILCDGEFNDSKGCKEKAQHIARSQVDPIACVYYCCNRHKESYEMAEFIIQNL